MSEKPRLLVDMVSDPVCPWCYVGLKSFAKAREALEDDFEVLARFRPYQLNPDTPLDGVDRAAYYARKFPDAAQRAIMRERLIEAARAAGVEFDPAKPTRLPNTLNAHRVIHWAQIEGRQEAAVHAIYGAFWNEDADLGDADTLTRLAGAAGLDADAVAAKLAAGEDSETVKQEAGAFRAAGVSGVPTFIVNERTGFSGALPPADLAASLRQAATG